MIKTETKRYINYELCANIVHCKAQCQNKINLFQTNDFSFICREKYQIARGPCNGMNHVHVGMACQEAAIMLDKKQNETILK